jgi:hypothetical protein
MRFDFFRRPSDAPVCPIEARAPAANEAMHPEAGGFVTYALLLDAQKRVKGYRLAWHMASPGVEPTAFESLRALLSCAATNLNPPKTGWRLGRLALFFDMTVDGLNLKELQALPPKNVVLCMDLDDLMNADIRSTLLRLRAQGFGFMLRGASRHWGLRSFSPLPPAWRPGRTSPLAPRVAWMFSCRAAKQSPSRRKRGPLCSRNPC